MRQRTSKPILHRFARRLGPACHRCRNSTEWDVSIAVDPLNLCDKVRTGRAHINKTLKSFEIVS
jgi:hypothetical protein